MTLTEIRPTDRRTMAQVDALLCKEGIQRDGNLDYTCGIFDDDGQLIATGSSFQNTLRCFAVDSGHQGEGLTNQVVSHLTERLAGLGMFHLFLYTKPASARFFSDLGFFEIARVEGELVFMENRRRGFADFCARLEAARRPGQSAAIVMNANPFTLGHRYLVEKAAGENDTLHLFLLSQEAGPIPFAVRRQLVRAGVAHLDNVVLHESGPYLISSATFPSYFLKSEDRVVRAHAALDLALFRSIAAALDLSARYVGDEPFSHTTCLYNEVMAAQLPQAGIDCRILPRLEINGKAVSASAVRQAIHDDALDRVRDLLPQSTYDYFASPEGAAVVAAIRRESDLIHH